MTNLVKHWYNKLPEIGYEMKPYAKEGKVTLPNRGKGNYDADLYFGRGVKFNGIDQSITMPINDTINTISNFKNGSLVIDETLQTLTDYITDINSADIYQNFIFYKGIFEPHEKRYMETNPEKFLYHEKQSDGTFIAKSEILSQSQIDNIVAHFPLCETDGYVRNMIGYSEGANKIDYANITIGTDGDGVSTLTLLADGFEIEQDGSGTLTDNPLITIPFINAETQLSGNTYIVTYNASLISGSNNA